MAKLVGPLLSEQATGQAGQVLYLPSASGTNAGKRSCEHFSKVGSAANARAQFKTVVQAWRQISANARATWDLPAGSSALAYQRFVSNNARLLSLGLDMVDVYQPPEPTTPHDGYEVYVQAPGFPTIDLWMNGGWAPGHYNVVYAAVSTLRRSAVDRRKYSYMAKTSALDSYITFDLPFCAPHIYLRIDEVAPLSGDLIRSDYIQASPDYSGGG